MIKDIEERWPGDDHTRSSPFAMMTYEQEKIFWAMNPKPANVHQWMGGKKEAWCLILSLSITGIIALVLWLTGYLE